MATILGVNAERTDGSLMESFFSFTANATAIRGYIKATASGDSPQHGFFYDSGPRTASYVTATGGRVIVLNVLNVERGKADEIEAKLKLNVAARMSLVPFQEVVEEVLGESINPEHRKGSYLAKWWTG